MTDENGKIISLTEMLESKQIKEKELLYYLDKLKEIQLKIGYLEFDLKLTKQIISMIEKDNIIQVDPQIPLLDFGKDNDNDS
jgi:hypothetical protein